MTRTSSISGTFVKRQRSPVRVAAARSFRAAFLAPLIVTVPRSGRPPSMRNAVRSIGSGRYSQWNGRASATVRDDLLWGGRARRTARVGRGQTRDRDPS